MPLGLCFQLIPDCGGLYGLGPVVHGVGAEEYRFGVVKVGVFRNCELMMVMQKLIGNCIFSIIGFTANALGLTFFVGPFPKCLCSTLLS